MANLNVRGEPKVLRDHDNTTARAVYDGDSPDPICTVEWTTGSGSSSAALELVQDYVDRDEPVPRRLTVDSEGNVTPHEA